MFFVSFIELISIGSILPIFTIIFNQEYLIEVNKFFEKNTFIDFRFKSHDNLVFFSLVVLFFVFTMKNIILVIFHWVQQKFSKDFIDHLSTSLFRIFINQPYEFFFNVKSSDLIRDISSEPSINCKKVSFTLFLSIEAFMLPPIFKINSLFFSFRSEKIV